MQERIEKFNRMVINSDLKKIPIGLYNGKMGLCIYFYEIAHLTSEKKYSVFAEKLLDDITNNVGENNAIDLENGLTGIGLAINYLLNKKYATGNPNYVLKDFDDKIIQSFLFNQIFSDNTLNFSMIGRLLKNLEYLAIRLQNSRLNKEERSIMQSVIIENINKIESSEIDKFTEPVFFSVTEYFTPLYLQLLQRIYQLHFYDFKIEKIVEGLSAPILYRYPLNKANRLALYSAMNETAATFRNLTGWNEHLELLRRHLDIPTIIYEFRNKNLSFFNGLCGFYYLLRKIGKSNEYNNLILNKISSSDVWNQLPENEDASKAPIGLYSGLSGVILTYLHILYNNDSKIFFDDVINFYV